MVYTMAITKEGEVKKQIKATLDKADVYYFMPSGNGYGRSGIPDFVCCVRGKFLAIEAKARDLQPTAIQARELSRIIAHEGTGIYINAENIHELPLLLEAIFNRTSLLDK